MKVTQHKAGTGNTIEFWFGSNLVHQAVCVNC